MHSSPSFPLPPLHRPVPWTRFTGLPRRLLAAVACALAPLATGCDAGGGERAYVERLGSDTMAVERFVRSGDRIEGDLLVRTPRTRLAHYTATLGPEGRITRLEVRWEAPGSDAEDAPTQHVTTEVGSDSATIIRRGEGVADTLRVAVSGDVIPSPARIPVPVAVWEQAVRQALASGADKYDFALLFPNGRPPAENRIVRRGADTVAMDFFGRPMLAAVDEEGRILGITGRETTMKVVVEPAASPPLDSLARAFAARDARGEGLGTLSPVDTLAATVAGADFEVVYGRPAMRGREIFGGLVPYGEVWRTGAGPATRFTTSRDLTIGGEEVPAGSYTLWTTFTPDSATLILNEETGQWGTTHDPERDLFRVSMDREVLPAPVERFTIDVLPWEGSAGDAILELSWDRSRFTVPMRVR